MEMSIAEQIIALKARLAANPDMRGCVKENGDA